MLKANYRMELELRLVAGMLNSKNFFYRIFNEGFNKEDLFSDEICRGIYEHMVDHFEEGSDTFDLITYHEYLMTCNKNQRFLERYKVVSTIAPTFEISSARILIQDSVKVSVIRVYEVMKNEVANGIDFAYELREKIDNILATKFENYSDTKEPSQILNELVSNIDDVRKGIKRNDYFSTGIPSLDEVIIGIPKGHLTIIAARPGFGKSAFALQLKRNLNDIGHSVGIISLEMKAEEILLRDISSLTAIDSQSIEKGELSDNEFQLIIKAGHTLSSKKFIIDDASNQSPERVKATIRKWILMKKCDIVFIDYLTQIKTNYKMQRYDLEIGQLSQDLRIFAKETGIPIVILSQLNRQVEDRPNKIPILRDLRESGQLEQDSKLIMFLYRPDYYQINPFRNGNSYQTYDKELLTSEEYLELIIAKNRNGKTGSIPLRYRPSIHRIESVKRVLRNNF